MGQLRIVDYEPPEFALIHSLGRSNPACALNSTSKNLMDTTTESFPSHLAAFCDQLGRERVASICGVSDRTLRYWLAGGIAPHKTMQAGAIMLLECHAGQERRNEISSRIQAQVGDLPPYTPEQLRASRPSWPCNVKAGEEAVLP